MSNHLKIQIKKLGSVESISYCSKTGFLLPNCSFFYLLCAFGAQKSDFKHSTFIAQELEEIGQKQPPEVFYNKRLFLELSQNSQENTCARVSFLIKLQVKACNFIKKEALVQACEFCEISKNTFLTRQMRVNASVRRLKSLTYFVNSQKSFEVFHT